MISIVDKNAELMTSEEITELSLPIKKILLATDGSIPSVKATKFAIGLAKGFGAEVLAVFVENGDDNIRLPLEVNEKDLFGGVYPSEAGLAVAKALGERNGVQVNTTILRGHAPKQIIKAAQAEEADLIILGESGRNSTGRFSLGSVAESIVRLASFPVLVVRKNW